MGVTPRWPAPQSEPDGHDPLCRHEPCTSGPWPNDVDARLDARQGRFDSWLIRYIGYLGLVIGLGLSPFVYSFEPEYLATIFGLSLASGLLTYAFVTRTPSLAERPPWGRVYVVALIALMALLCHQSGIFGFQSFAGYIHSFAYLRGRARWVGLGVTAIVVAYGQLGGSALPREPGVLIGWFVLAILNAGVAGTFMYFSQLSSAQSERRREVINALDEANRRLSEILGENAALQARLLASAREAGVLDERARLAREIHDTIAQGLAGVVAQLEAAAAADDDPVTRRRHSDTAMALARESLTEARRSVEALTPGQLDRAQLPDAIAEMAKRWGETAGVDLVLDTTGNPVLLLPELEVVLFRVAQEALANVGKHAGARRVGLTLSYMGDVVVLDVRDDGHGFAPADVVTTGESGYGLAAMEQRVRQVSGTFTVESAPGEGTALSASVPAIPAEVRS